MPLSLQKRETIRIDLFIATTAYTMISFTSARFHDPEQHVSHRVSIPLARIRARAHLHIITISIWWHVNTAVSPVLAVYSRAHLRLPPACLCARHRHPAIVQSLSLSVAPPVRSGSFLPSFRSAPFFPFFFFDNAYTSRLTTHGFFLPHYKDAQHSLRAMKHRYEDCAIL